MGRRRAARAMARLLAVACVGACDPGVHEGAAVASRDGAVCGDGLVDEGEGCDLGFANRPDGPCRACRLPACGDGVRDPGEACDDGDDDDTNACRADCTATLGEQWSRRWDGGPAGERVVDLWVDGSGDAIAVGWRDAGVYEGVRPWITRYTPGGDRRWSVPLGELGVARAVAQRDDGDLVVAVTSTPQPELPGEVRVVQVALADGSIRLDVMPTEDTGQSVAIATTGDAVFVAYNEEEGGGRVLGLDAAGAVASSYAVADVPLATFRALATLPGGDLIVAGGDAAASRGFVARISPAGEPRFAVDDLDGPVIDVVADDEGVLAAITARVEAPDAAQPWTWTTAVEIVALAGDGGQRWSTRLAPERGRRDAGALAWAGDRVVVVGADPWPTATCAPAHCEQRPWAAALDRADGGLTWAVVLEPGLQGRAHAVGLVDGAVLVGGELRPLFFAAAGFVSRRVEASP